MARDLLTVIGIQTSAKRRLCDGAGLWLHRSKAGQLYWTFIYTRSRKRREMGLGPYGTKPGQVSLAAARRKADEIRRMLAEKGDPFTDLPSRQRKVVSATFGEVVDEYIETMKPRWRGRQTEAGWLRFATTHAEPIRKIPIAEISTDDVVRMLRPIWSTLPETASKARERTKMVLDHAKARGLRTGDNPAVWRGHLDQILPARDELAKTNHPAMPYPEVPAFLRAVIANKTPSHQALGFIILTAARSGEARGAEWAEIDLAAKVWTVPAVRMKSGREHRVPLSEGAMAILATMKERRLGDLVFPGRVAKRPLSDVAVSKPLGKLGAGQWTVHGFRSSFRDWAGEVTAHSREVAEAALAHSIGDSAEKAYRRGDALEKRRALMSDWCQYVVGREAAATNT